ncbi:somatic embryogenesis receptor kinase 4 [Vigna unguiculata]|uniref:non-specific serine/threonine protein kinase n=1 Tax=Vigna unguiculata TaxID=3917 RepID=A0A4D6KPJ9_VIGUN|nr:somatic embryogenesis receptor kinase 4 [Vigna unguiculata]
MTLINQCNYTLWPALSNRTGFVLASGENSSVGVPENWQGRIWARTHCTTDSVTGNFSCATGDCNSGNLTCNKEGSPPETVVEFNLEGVNGFEFYYVSLLQGFNVPVIVDPMSGSGGKCESTGCGVDLNAVCPTELKVTRNEEVVGCENPCDGSDSSCEIFETACPQASINPVRPFNCSNPAYYNIVFCPKSTNASQRVGDSLIAGNGTSKWLSSSGDFAFGFYQLPNKLFLLAIWYNHIQNGSIIWYANGENLAPIGSKLELNASRGLVLRTPEGLELWRSNFTSGPVFTSQMNDDGNFQLLDQNFVSLWESFIHPTDTLVPTQALELGGELFSRQGEFNFSTGRFTLYMQQDGNLVLKLINLLSNYSNAPYFNTGTADANNKTNVGMRFVFDKSGFLYVLKKSGEKFKVSTSNETISSNDVYYKATLNFDGVLTVSYYPKDPNKEQRWVTLKTIPENICLNSTIMDGGGVCGFNSICNLKDDQRPMCNCPERYSLIDSNNMYGGCIPNFEVNCEGGGHMNSQDDYIMEELQNTDWQKSDYKTVSPYTLEECTKSCLQDCLCVLVTFSGSSCRQMKLPLINGISGKEVNVTSIMKLMKNDELLTPLPKQKMNKDHDTLIIVISVLLGFSVFVIFMLVGAMYFCFSYNRKKIKRGRTNDGVVEKNLRNFTFKELVEATRNFSEELGRGSFSIVYKGTIDITSVAVKKLDKLFEDNNKEFQTEVNVIGQTHHRNLVRLLGYCNEGQHRILVYEFMSNGTLASFLFTPLKANWRQRFDIASGIARGLVYLHEECCTQIIHCDIKPQNILLDDQCNARISDFGLAKLLLINQSHTETAIRGTKGRNVEKEIIDEEKGILTDWAYDCYKTRRLDILLENDVEAINNIKSFEKFVMVALWCIHEDPSLRPTMKKVLLMLEGIIDVSKPPNPYLYTSLS